MSITRQYRHLIRCDSRECSIWAVSDAEEVDDVELEVLAKGWITRDGKHYYCPTCQGRVKKRSATPDPLAFLDTPSPGVEKLTKQRALREKLEEARDDWSSRSYIQNAGEHTKWNEDRRAKKVKLMNDLMDKFDVRGEWTPATEALVKKLVDATFK